MRTLRSRRRSAFHAVTYALGGRVLIALSSGSRAGFWDMGTFSELLDLYIPLYSPFRAHVALQGKLLVLNNGVLDVGGALTYCRRAAEGAGGGRGPVPKKPLYAPLDLEDSPPVNTRYMAFAPYGNVLAGVAGGAFHTGVGPGLRWAVELILWDRRGGCRGRAPLAGVDREPATAFAPDGRTLAATGGKDVLLCRAATGQEVARLRHPGAPGRLLFSPDGRLLATTVEQSVWLWDVSTPSRFTLVARLPVSSRYAEALAFHPGGRLLAAGTPDGAVRLWDVRGLKEVACYDWGVGAVHGLAFAPDGLTAAAAGEESAVAVWDVEV